MFGHDGLDTSSDYRQIDRTIPARPAQWIDYYPPRALRTSRLQLHLHLSPCRPIAFEQYQQQQQGPPSQPACE